MTDPFAVEEDDPAYGRVPADEGNAEEHDITFVTQPTRRRLSERQCLDYAEHRAAFIRWLYVRGKDPETVEGYAHETVRRTASQLDAVFRWLWDREDGYTLDLTTEDADRYLDALLVSDESVSHKRNTRKAFVRYFRWRDTEWDPDVSFGTGGGSTQPRDYLTREERQQVCEAALDYETVPSYDHLTPDERDHWKTILAQRLRKPKDDVTPADFTDANGYKVPSLVFTSLDAGLRPIEVGRARVSWVDTDNSVLRIPIEDSSKNQENWTVALRDRTARILDHWLDERATASLYDDTDRLWLTREGNPYSSSSLSYLLRRLCEAAGIDTDHRDLSWYALRHSTGTYVSREDGLKAAKSQLRHKSIQTTAKYDNTPVEERRDALESI